MFEQSEEIAAWVDGVYGVLSEMDRGDLLEHRTVESITGLERNTGRYQHCVNMARRRLEQEQGIATWPDKPGGFRLLSLDQQIHELPNWRRRKAKRQHTKAERSLKSLPMQWLSLHQQNVRLAQIEKIQQARREIEREIRLSDPKRHACDPMPRIAQ